MMHTYTFYGRFGIGVRILRDLEWIGRHLRTVGGIAWVLPAPVRFSVDTTA